MYCPIIQPTKQQTTSRCFDGNILIDNINSDLEPRRWILEYIDYISADG